MNARQNGSPEVTTVGEAMAVLTPASRGALRGVRAFESGVGGAEANVAVALARLGHGCGYSGALGDDELGAGIREFLRAEGVDASRLRLDPNRPTGLYLKEFRARDSLRVHYYRDGSAASRMSAGEADLDWLLSARIVHLTGITAVLSENCYELVRHIAQAANDRGVEVCFDANIRHRLLGDRDAYKTLAPFVNQADLLFFSEEEAGLLLGAQEPEEVERAAAGLRAHTVIVHGAERAFAVATAEGQARVFEAGTVPVGVEDPVGAGDAFVAGFLAGKLRGMEVEQCLRLANACGGCAASLPGDAESMPYAEDVANELGDEARSER